VGQVLAARYRIGERVGAGGMGTVFRAEHVKIGRKLAVKVLHPAMLESEKYRRRFAREAELAGRMRHPNVVGVLDAGITPEGLHYLVMEYAEGRTLAELIHEGPMEGPRVLGLAKQLCDGLQHAHDQGLVHRDFKPDNVIVERDRHGDETPRILDFGVAIALTDFTSGERERLTTKGMVLGTPHYMAPEHATGKPIDHRIDLFALGVMCFEMLTGVMPFRGTGVEIARAYLGRPIPPMQQRAPYVEVDPLLEAFTRALLAKSPDARPASARAASELLALIERDRAAAAQRLDVRLKEQRRTLPVSPAPPPARVPSGTSPPPAPSVATVSPTAPSAPPVSPTAPSAPPAWTDAPTEKMSTDPEGPAIAPMAQPASAAAAGAPAAASAAGAPAAGAPAVPDMASGEPAAGAPTVPIAAPAVPAVAVATAVPAAEAAPPGKLERGELVASVAMPKLERGAPAAPGADAPVPELPPRTAPPVGASLATEMVRPLSRKAPQGRSGRRRAAWIAAALAGVVLCAAGVLALRGRRSADAPAAAQRPEAPPSMQAQAPAPPAETAPPAPSGPGRASPSAATASASSASSVSSTPAAPSAATAARPAPAAAPTAAINTPADPAAPAAPEPPAPAPTAPPAVAPRPPATPALPAPAPAPAETPQTDPPTAVVAELYGTIGRSLKRLDETRGQEATYDLWPRFRRIRIFEALRTRDGRVAAQSELRYLEREIGQRAN
jgi:serine/threonine-protein kinase